MYDFDPFLKKLSGKNILLTGGAGFIGSHIAERLIKSQMTKLLIVDNLSTGNLDNLRITGVLDDKRVIFCEKDVQDIEYLHKLFVNEKIDIVCHQAALGSVPRSLLNPMDSHKTNVDGFFNMLVKSKEFGVKRFVYASSSSVYGDSEVLPKVEQEVGDVISPYAATKKINEIYANVFYRCYGMETIGLRYFNVFGPRQSINGPYAAVIPRFAEAIKKNESPVIYGNGEQSRDFTYVENAVYANILAMTFGDLSQKSSPEDHKKNIFGRVYNVASGTRITLNKMYDNVKEITGTLLNTVYENTRQGDIPHSWASIIQTKEMLGYEPIVTFKDGLRMTLKYYLEG